MQTIDKQQLTTWIKQEAAMLGFMQVGIAEATELTEEAKRLEAWLHKGYHGAMGYMENHFEKRIDPRRLVEGAKSVITLSFNYFPAQIQTDVSAPKLAKYAFGKDYHIVVKDKANQLLSDIRARVGDISGRAFVDSAPVMEREWAKRSGIGWFGKNTLIIHPREGSFYFLAVLILDLDLVYDAPMSDYCGRCRRCIDACPTDAIDQNGYIMDASKCISYLTIELKDELPEVFRKDMKNWMFGCDICQDVCPWNRFSKPHTEPNFEPYPQLLDMTKADWEDLTQETFQTIFKHSAVKRTKYSGLERNIAFLKEKSD
jgi:epoxyqueuosine reductase